jgi:hypothetical protein
MSADDIRTILPPAKLTPDDEFPNAITPPNDVTGFTMLKLYVTGIPDAKAMMEAAPVPVPAGP